MPLYAHQQAFLDKNPDKSSLIWSCGIGKTRTAIEWAASDKKGKTATLVICPKALKTNWLKEINKHDGGDRSSWTVVTKEEFKKIFKETPNMIAFPQVIVDEVHVGFLTPMWKSQMSKALKQYLGKNKIKRVLLLSATPYTSSPWNIYNLAWLTGHEWSWRTFKLTFFFDVQMGPRTIPMARKGCEAELADLTKGIADVVDIHDVMDVPLQLHADPEYFSLTPSQKQGIKLAYDPLPIVRYTRQHEVEQGFLIRDEGETAIFPSDKVERIKALCEENPKLAIVCRYNAQIDELAEVLKDFNPLIIRGATKNRHAVCEAAENANKAVVLIQADCAEGYQLPSFPLCVFASQSYSYVKWEQMCGRFLRMDKPSRTTFMYLLTDGDSIDQAVYDAVRRKEDFKIELFAKK